MQPLGFVSVEFQPLEVGVMLWLCCLSPALAAGDKDISPEWAEMANLGDPASPPSGLRKSATSLKQDLKSVLWSQNKHPEIFIIMLLLKVLNVLYLKWNSFVLTCFHMLAFTRLQNCLIWLSNVTVMNLLGNGAIECIHCATPLWNILLDLLDSWFYFF